MLDLHTHILPAMDDGSRDVGETMQMLAAQKAQGVTAIALTPHFYPHREDPARFLRRRARCFEKMQSASEYASYAPQHILLGAEVAYFEGIGRAEDIDALCLGDTGAILVEMPFTRWNDRMLRELEELRKTCRLQPVLAHVERFMQFQPAGLIEEVCDSGVLMQVNASFFQQWTTRRKAIKMLERGQIHFLGSDCHNMDSRKPNMAEAIRYIDKKLGHEALQYLCDMEKKLLEGTR